ncbi:MAG: hypothetical protein WD040_07300, partial [Anaerolineales bacterium]
MSSSAAVASPGSVRARSKSWIDWVLERVESLGWPLWVFYPTLGILEAVVVHISKWSDGSLAFPALSPVHLLLALWTAYPLGLIHALDRLADRALDVFRPALGEGQESLPQLRRALTTMPAGPVLLASAAGIGVLWTARTLTPQLFAPALTSPSAGALWMALASLNFALVGSLIYHTLRQLKLVHDIYARTQKINLFIPEPLYAFSSLSATTGAGWILLLYGTISAFPAILTSGLATVLLAFMFTLSGATFLLPLVGIHNKIVRAKRALLAEVGQRTQSAVQEVYRKLDKDDVD